MLIEQESGISTAMRKLFKRGKAFRGQNEEGNTLQPIFDVSPGASLYFCKYDNLPERVPPSSPRRMIDQPEIPSPADAYQARQWIADLRAQLVQRDIFFRDAPEEPTSCCGRGCNGCVWEGYLNAVGYWCGQVRDVLAKE